MKNVFQQKKKILLLALCFALVSFGFSANAADLKPKTMIIPVIPQGSTVVNYNTSSFIRTVNGLISNGYNVDVYGGRFSSSGYLQSVQTVPFSYNTDAAFNYVNSALQTTDAAKFVIYGGGHGSPGANGSTEAFGRGDAFASKMPALNVQQGQKGSIFDQSCYSADRCGMSNLFVEGSPIESFTGASLPGKKTSSNALEDVLSNQPSAGDINGDGIMSASELNSIDYTNIHRFKNGGSARIGTETVSKDGADPDLFYKNGHELIQQPQVICIVPRPGQSPDFGPVTDEPGIYRPGGFIQDTDLPIKESKKNYDLRYLGGDTMAVQIAQAEVQAPESATKKTIHPDGTQAQQFIESMGGNPKNRGSYKINGTDVPVGQYLANHKNQETGITFDDKCENPKQEGKAPDPGKTTPPGGGANPGFGSPGNGGGFGNFGNGGGGFGDGGGGLGGLLGGGGAGGGLAALLPLLMQGLMGGGQGGLGGQQGYGQQGQYGAGYGNQQQQPPCANQPIAPACGTDGNTYKNSCYANQQGAILRSTGICAPVVPSPIPTINSIVTLTQLSQSGIPATLLENVRNLVSSVLSNILSGSAVSETVVR